MVPYRQLAYLVTANLVTPGRKGAENSPASTAALGCKQLTAVNEAEKRGGVRRRDRGKKDAPP